MLSGDSWAVEVVGTVAPASSNGTAFGFQRLPPAAFGLVTGSCPVATKSGEERLARL